VGSHECADEPSGSGATELVSYVTENLFSEIEMLLSSK
jgi:hypothetical protein